MGLPPTRRWTARRQRVRAPAGSPGRGGQRVDRLRARHPMQERSRRIEDSSLTRRSARTQALPSVGFEAGGHHTSASEPAGWRAGRSVALLRSFRRAGLGWARTSTASSVGPIGSKCARMHHVASYAGIVEAGATSPALRTARWFRRQGTVCGSSRAGHDERPSVTSGSGSGSGRRSRRWTGRGRRRGGPRPWRRPGPSGYCRRSR